MESNRRGVLGALLSSLAFLFPSPYKAKKVIDFPGEEGPHTYVCVTFPDWWPEHKVAQLRETMRESLPPNAYWFTHPECVKVEIRPGGGVEYFREKIGDYEVEVVAKPEDMKERLSFLTGIPVTAITTTTPAPWKEDKNWSPPIHSNNTRLFYKDGSYKDVPTTVAWHYFDDPDYSHSVAGPSSSPDNWWWDEKDRRWVIPGINDKGAY